MKELIFYGLVDEMQFNPLDGDGEDMPEHVGEHRVLAEPTTELPCVT